LAVCIAAHSTLAIAQEATPQRPTFTYDTTLAPSGSVELEAGGALSEPSQSLPLTTKWNPGATELSVSFDAVASDGTSTEFGDRISVLARRSFEIDGPWSLGVAPRATFLLRGDSGARLGAIAVAAYASGLDAVVGNVTFDAATDSSETNPATQWDFALDYYRTFGRSARLSRFTAFAGVLHQRPQDEASTVSLMQGVLVRVRPELVLDVAVQEDGIEEGPVRWKALFGLTYNFGRI
jgi:hypothetical protein